MGWYNHHLEYERMKCRSLELLIVEFVHEMHYTSKSQFITVPSRELTCPTGKRRSIFKRAFKDHTLVQRANGIQRKPAFFRLRPNRSYLVFTARLINPNFCS